MTRSRIATAVTLAALVLAGCKSREEKLIDRRNDLREALDELYESYTGADRAKEDRQRESGVFGRLVAEVDRAHFDEYCLAVGRGERPFALSSRMESFMKDSSHARACRKAAKLKLEVDELEREPAAR
jgi:hypothetical protein